MYNNLYHEENSCVVYGDGRRGPKGEKGDKGHKGEKGDKIKIKLIHYISI